ncbi:MAG TPA: S-methyl-5-thioribose-1-phosphate isomerase [Nitrospirae bacterium]|nr:S-methyl-5-thioribose-1-phosphate isomerase [Nitrospirota bacterium]
MIKSIEWADDRVRILDQSRLPHEVSYIECTDYRMVADAIKTLKIRGAPAIGIAAAMGVALHAQGLKAADYEEFMASLGPVIDTMLSTRPTAVNIRWAMERLKTLLDENRHEGIEALKRLLVDEAEAILAEDIAVNRAIGTWGAEFIRDGATVLTHCNAGALATGGYGTATAPILVAMEQGKEVRVIADETRPVLQGARLTTWELMQSGVPVTLITDNSAGALMRKGAIDLCIVGTDRTVRNGDVANKIGTYSVAVLARENGVPFYVAAPFSSIDFTLSSGEEIPIEERPAEEVTHVCGCRIAPEGVGVVNMAFDVTPARYITAIITEKGAFRPEDLKKLAETGTDPSELRLKS